MGGVAFGPRFVVPMLPLCVAVCVPFVARLLEGPSRKAWRGVVAFLVVFGVATQLSGTLTRMNLVYDHAVGGMCMDDWFGVEEFDHEEAWDVDNLHGHLGPYFEKKEPIVDGYPPPEV